MQRVDSFRHKGLRNKLVALLRTKGIVDEKVLTAIAQVPRHFFLDSGLDIRAYDDIAIPIDAQQTISQPYTVAMQTQLLNVKVGERVLEIGTGSGYQAAVLCQIGVELYTIERQEALYNSAKKMLSSMGYNPTLIFGDGFAGYMEKAPYSKIIVTCGASNLPQTLLEQLAIGGRMVIPVGSNGGQQMYTIDRINETDFKQTKHGKCSFVPMLEGVNKKQL